MANFERLAPAPSAAVRIAEQILSRIDAREYPVGTKLPTELELSRAFGVSRASVREALGALQFVGYIESVRGSGSRVIATRRTPGRPGTARTRQVGSEELTGPTIIDVFEARLELEPRVAAAAARRPVAAGIENAWAVIDGMRMAAHEPSLEADTDLAAHRAIAELCPNDFLRRPVLDLLELAGSDALRAIRAQAWDNRVLPPIWGGQHAEVMSAIERGDDAAAAEASWEHLASSVLNALTVLGQQPDVDEQAIARIKQAAQQGPAFTGPAPLRAPTGRTSDTESTR